MKSTDLLKSMAKKEETKTKKKNEHPVVNLTPNRSVVEAIHKWITSKRIMETNEAIVKQQAAILNPICAEQHANTCKSNGKYFSTVDFSLDCKKFKDEIKKSVLSKDDQDFIDALPDSYIVAFCTVNKYSNIPSDREDSLHSLINTVFDLKGDQKKMEEKFKELFETQTVVSLSEAAMNPEVLEGLLGKLVKALGEEDFVKYFSVERGFKPTENFHQQRFFNNEVKAFAKSAIDNGLIKPQTQHFKA